jgi:hypothetical protein
MLELKSWAKKGLILFVAMLCAPHLHGQGTAGSITGSVTDPAGAMVPSATVTATNQGTQASRSAESDSKGSYLIPLLTPGTYSVKAEKTGFASAESSGVIVQVSQSTLIDFQFRLGTVGETVSVASSAPLLETGNSTVGQVIGTQPTTALPLNGRDFLSLAVLTPGAVTQIGNSARLAQTGSYAGNNEPVIAGNRQGSATLTLDGFLDQRPYDLTPAIRPSIDALQEFKIESSNLTAGKGRNPVLVEIVTKSGTNSLHGAAWDFLRNNALDARQYFDTQIPPLHRNQFGAVLGGPVLIPHLYDGKDKTFFLFNWESSRYSVGQTASGTFMPTAFLSGDFSSLQNGQGQHIQLYDPATTDPTTGLRQAFVNNQIPLSRLDPVGLKMATEFRATPNSAGFPNTVGVLISPENNDQYTGHLDQIFGPHSIMLRGSDVQDTQHNVSLQPFGGQYVLNTDIDAGGRWTYAIRPNLLNQARIGWLFSQTLLEEEAVQANKNLNAESGIQNITFFPQFSYSVPLVGCTGSIYSCPSGGQSFKEISHVMEYGDTLTYSHGAHTSAFGFTIYRSDNIWASGGATGNYTFNGTYTAQQGAGFAAVPGTGDATADFLLGQTISAGLTSAGGNGDYLDTYYSIFGQDEWRATPKLTLNLGVNWQYSGPYIEKYGRETFFDYSAEGEAIGGRQLNNCQIGFKGRNGIPANYAYNPVYNPGNNFGTVLNPSLCITDLGKGAREYGDFQPRLGAAYRAQASTVLRGGFGLFFDNPQWASEMAGMSGDPPFPLFASLNSLSFTTSQYPLDQLFPPFNDLTAQTTGRDVGPPLLGRRLPYTYEWTVSIQQELGSANVFEVGYIGSASRHLQILNPINQARPDLPGVTTPIVSRLPFPNFGGIGGIEQQERVGNQYYEGGYARFERRFTNGLSLLASYTLSRDKGWNGEQNEYVTGGPSVPIQNTNCLRCSYGLVPEDVRNRLVGTGSYDLPFGRGRDYLSGAQGIQQAVVGGWQLNVIGTLQSGVPLTCFDSNDTANVGFGGQCNYAPGYNGPPPQEKFQKTGFAFNPAYFVPKAVGQEFGDTPPNILRTGRTNNIDLSIFKNFLFAERVNLQFRAEFFNAFNITQFVAPDNEIRDPTFGKYVPSPQTIGVNASPSVAAARQIQLALKLTF